MTKKTWALVVASAVALCGIAGVGATGKNSYNPVTVTIADQSATETPYHVRSDAKGAYATVTVKGQQTVYSSIERYQTGTDWMLTTYYGTKQTPSGRTVFFDLSEPVSTANPTPPPGGQAPAHLIAHCRLINVDLLALNANDVVECPGVFRFKSSNGAWYRFAFNRANYPQVDPLKVTCLTSDTAGCKSWSITPSGGDPMAPRNVAKLLEITSNGDVVADMGDYYLSFNFMVTREDRLTRPARVTERDGERGTGGGLKSALRHQGCSSPSSHSRMRGRVARYRLGQRHDCASSRRGQQRRDDRCERAHARDPRGCVAPSMYGETLVGTPTTA